MIRPMFSRVIEIDKPQGATYKGSEGIPTNIVQVIGSIP